MSKIKIILSALCLLVGGMTMVSIHLYNNRPGTLANNGGYLSSSINKTTDFSGTVQANSFYSVSDARIKNIEGVSNSEKDLNTLKKIEVTDYRYVDVIANGNLASKKVIAQQVEDVYPSAVRQKTDFIPNVFSNANRISFDGNQATITVDELTDIHSGDKVKLYNTNDEAIIVKVSSVKGNSFTVENIDKEKAGSKVFVYGKEVSDFRTVDYDAISMLNVSATQELSKQVEAQQKEIIELKKTMQMMASEQKKSKTDSEASLK